MANDLLNTAATTSDELDLNLIFNVMMVMITDLISNIHSHMDIAYHGFITIKDIITAQTTPPVQFDSVR